MQMSCYICEESTQIINWGQGRKHNHKCNQIKHPGNFVVLVIPQQLYFYVVYPWRVMEGILDLMMHFVSEVDETENSGSRRMKSTK